MTRPWLVRTARHRPSCPGRGQTDIGEIDAAEPAKTTELNFEKVRAAERRTTWRGAMTTRGVIVLAMLAAVGCGSSEPRGLNEQRPAGAATPNSSAPVDSATLAARDPDYSQGKSAFESKDHASAYDALLRAAARWKDDPDFQKFFIANLDKYLTALLEGLYALENKCDYDAAEKQVARAVSVAEGIADESTKENVLNWRLACVEEHVKAGNFDRAAFHLSQLGDHKNSKALATELAKAKKEAAEVEKWGPLSFSELYAYEKSWEGADRVNYLWKTLFKGKRVRWRGKYVAEETENGQTVLKIRHLKSTWTCDVRLTLMPGQEERVASLEEDHSVLYEGVLETPTYQVNPYGLVNGVLLNDNTPPFSESLQARISARPKEILKRDDAILSKALAGNSLVVSLPPHSRVVLTFDRDAQAIELTSEMDAVGNLAPAPVRFKIDKVTFYGNWIRADGADRSLRSVWFTVSIEGLVDPKAATFQGKVHYGKWETTAQKYTPISSEDDAKGSIVRRR